MAKLVRLFEDSNILVADIKKKCIIGVIKVAEKFPKVQRIVLFGSALEERCSDYSDIDLAVYVDCTLGKLFNSSWFSKFKKEIFLLDLDQDYDFIPMAKKMSIGEEIKNNIESGRIIYESDKK